VISNFFIQVYLGLLNCEQTAAHRVSLFADRLQREGLITHNQRTGILEIIQQGIDYLDQAS